MTTAERPARTVYTCQRCGRPVPADQVHVKTLEHIERERTGTTGRRIITVQAAEVVAVRHLAPCAPEKEN